MLTCMPVSNCHYPSFLCDKSTTRWTHIRRTKAGTYCAFPAVKIACNGHCLHQEELLLLPTPSCRPKGPLKSTTVLTSKWSSREVTSTVQTAIHQSQSPISSMTRANLLYPIELEGGGQAHWPRHLDLFHISGQVSVNSSSSNVAGISSGGSHPHDQSNHQWSGCRQQASRSRGAASRAPSPVAASPALLIVLQESGRQEHPRQRSSLSRAPSCHPRASLPSSPSARCVIRAIASLLPLSSGYFCWLGVSHVSSLLLLLLLFVVMWWHWHTMLLESSHFLSRTVLQCERWRFRLRPAHFFFSIICIITFLTPPSFTSTVTMSHSSSHSTARTLQRSEVSLSSLHRHHHQHHPHRRNLQHPSGQIYSYHHRGLTLSNPSINMHSGSARHHWPYHHHLGQDILSSTSSQSHSSYQKTQTRHASLHQSIQQCPDGPPSQWENQLDVAAKALLAPVVFYGQLISLAEDYGGRIGATFRLLKLVKPSATSVIGHQQTQSELNVNMSQLTSLLSVTGNYETHIKLYFVRNRNASLEPPFCAQYMPDIWEKLRTKERYILFAHSQVLSTRGYAIPSTSPSIRSVSSTGHHSNMVHQTNHKSSQPSLASQAFRHHGHQLVSLVTYAIPELHSRNTSRLVRKVLCKGCAKPAVVHSSREVLHVNARGNITLACRVDGNPIPWIEWYRNGKRLRTRRRVTIHTKRRVSHLTVIRASMRRDKGIYECRAMNVVSKEPSVKRFQVLVTWPSEQLSRRRRPDLQQRHPPAYHPVLKHNGTGTLHPPSHYLPSVPSLPTEPFPAQPCPIASYCLNGGTCSLYETVGEYVCQCADGYRGQRCEFKDIYKYPAQKALLDYDLGPRTLHSYMSKTDEERSDI